MLSFTHISFLSASALLAITPVTSLFLPRDTAESAWAPFANGFNPADQMLWSPQTGPGYEDVSQGSTGDCWLDASMASVAYADQAHLESIMDDPHNSDGTVTVTLWDGSQSTANVVTKVTVNQMKAQYSDSAPEITGDNWVWPAAMEMAFMNFAGAHPDTNINGNLDGGTPISALKAMYGPSATIIYEQISNTDDANLWKTIQNAPTKPTITTSQSLGSTLTADGLPADHAYSVIRSDERIGMMTLRNPWGSVSENGAGIATSGGAGIIDHGYGVFDISFADWKTYFVDITSIA